MSRVPSHRLSLFEVSMSIDLSDSFANLTIFLLEFDGYCSAPLSSSDSESLSEHSNTVSRSFFTFISVMPTKISLAHSSSESLSESSDACFKPGGESSSSSSSVLFSSLSTPAFDSGPQSKCYSFHSSFSPLETSFS